MVIPKVQKLLTEYSYHPTIRGIFYRLVTNNVITNVYKNYKGLIAALSRAREKDRLDKGYIDVYAFADDTRFITDIRDKFLTPEEYIDYHISILKNSYDAYLRSGYLTRWHNQPNYVEVMIEKGALRRAFKDVLTLAFGDSVLSVRVIPNNGWSSKVYKQTTIDRLLSHKGGYAENGEGPKRVYVLYFGDSDPSGLRMSDNIKKDLAKLGINFIRVGLNKNHISEYGLDYLRNPDPEIIAKLKRDSNRYQFKAQNNGELFQIELDALQKNSEAFKNLILTPMKKYYHQEIYERNLTDLKLRSRDMMDSLVNKKVLFLE
jgi:hypothetical protein